MDDTRPQEWTIFTSPKRSNWVFHLGDMRYRPPETFKINWFQRLMWRLLLGGRWIIDP